MERRIADPDSHEDQLALQERAEAEAMWEEQMGRGRGGGGGGGGGSRLEIAAEKLKASYQEREVAKQKRVIQQISPRADPRKRPAPGAVPLGGRGKDPRRL